MRTPILVSVEHTRRARELIGPDALLILEQKVVLSRSACRPLTGTAALAWYLDTPNYLDNLRWLGFADADFEVGGYDALIDALVAGGDGETIASRVKAHLDAGATQVALQPIEDDDPFGLTRCAASPGAARITPRQGRDWLFVSARAATTPRCRGAGSSRAIGSRLNPSAQAVGLISGLAPKT